MQVHEETDYQRGCKGHAQEIRDAARGRKCIDCKHVQMSGTTGICTQYPTTQQKGYATLQGHLEIYSVDAPACRAFIPARLT